jgi:hypothetical protein
MTDDDRVAWACRHAAAMGRAARKTGENEAALRAMWTAFCDANGLEFAIGWSVALAVFTGRTSRA